MNGRERALAMLSGRQPDRLPLMPITMMFAARHAGVKYGDYARDHRVLAEAQIRTAEAYGFDYVSAISDPAREASDLGAAIEWFDDQPPAIVESRALLATKQRLAGLDLPDPAVAPRMHDRVQAVHALRERVGQDLLVEGWVEGPCAMSADLRGVNTLMLDFFDDSTFVRDLFEFCVEMELCFARAQIAAGADIIGVGDAAASLIGPKLYSDYVQSYERKLVQSIQKAGAPVRLHICGKTRKLYRGMAATGAAMIDLDWMAPMADARAEMGPSPVLAGNLDPVRVIRDGTPAEIQADLAECHRAAGERYIVAAGCEVPAGTPEVNLRAMEEFASRSSLFR
jgi:MtaA/CmuA family methyltransferase